MAEEHLQAIKLWHCWIRMQIAGKSASSENLTSGGWAIADRARMHSGLSDSGLSCLHKGLACNLKPILNAQILKTYCWNQETSTYVQT